METEQIDFIDSYMEEDEEKKSRSSLSSQFMAYIEKRITREVGALPVAPAVFCSPDPQTLREPVRHFCRR